MASQQDIIDLLNRFRAGTASREETEALFALLGEPGSDEEIVAILEQQLDGFEMKEPADNKYWQQQFAGFTDRVTGEGGRKRIVQMGWWKYAAAVLLILSVATYLWLVPGRPAKPPLSVILPGGNRAVLTLGDGSTITLDKAVNGSLAHQGNTDIVKMDSGLLAYKAGNSTGNILMNTITTPKGGQFEIALPDGSKVWLNAASSIRFPTAFSTKRIVTVTGEVYFEIAPDAAKPFVVKTYGSEIEVLGTSFNVNAYADEPAIATTLLEGRVRVNTSKGVQTLQPGEQSVIDNAQIRLENHPDVNQVMAWKNGAFSFYNTDLSVVMRQLSRWYNVDVIYEGKITNKRISGSMGRDLNLSEVMEGLKGLGVNARLEDNQLIINVK